MFPLGNTVKSPFHILMKTILYANLMHNQTFVTSVLWKGKVSTVLGGFDSKSIQEPVQIPTVIQFYLKPSSHSSNDKWINLLSQGSRHLCTDRLKCWRKHLFKITVFIFEMCIMCQDPFSATPGFSFLNGWEFLKALWISKFLKTLKLELSWERMWTSCGFGSQICMSFKYGLQTTDIF